MMKAGLCSVLACVVLGGCAYGIDEHYFFIPKPAAQRAADPSEMRIIDQERITGPFASDQYLDGRPPILAGRLPATLTHDLKSFGGGRTAITLAKAANGPANEPLIVFCGGNAWDRINRGAAYLDKLLPWGEVLLFDYPGYGDSTGLPYASSFDAVFKDMAPWLDGLGRDRPLVLWGHSIGGLVCSRLASQSREVDALVLETTAKSPDRIAKDKTWAIPVVDVQVRGDWKDFDAPKMLAGFSGPILVVGAGKDRTLPAPLARELAATLEGEGLKVTYREYAKAGHLNATLNSDFAKDALVFFQSLSDLRH
jgi:pimeloyl-ACP methyl ester carboxylesterase